MRINKSTNNARRTVFISYTDELTRMSKRRIDPGKAKDIARERMDILLNLSFREASDGNIERSRRYVHIARRAGMKTKVPIPKEILYCKKCGVTLVPGKTSRVRLNGHKITTRCLECDSARRMPYIKEQKT